MSAELLKMEKLLSVLVFGAVFACVYAATVYKDLPYYKMRSGKKSSMDDDAESLAVCTNYYSIANCSCDPYKNCDGAWMRSTEFEYKCVAYNGGLKKGVYAKAHCIRAMYNVASETTTDPAVECPRNYRIIGCQMHSYIQHEHPTCKALMSGGKCQINGCGKDGPCTECRVQARCIRENNY